jgi:hypothetical protein
MDHDYDQEFTLTGKGAGMCVAGLIMLAIALLIAGTVVPGLWTAIAGIKWLELIGALAPVATAVIALLALRNWKRQDKAKREAEFLDALVEAALSYVAQISGPVTILKMAKIGMTSYAPTWEDGDEASIALKGAIAYIEKNGDADGKRLLEALDGVRSLVVKLRSLAAKGQIFHFNAYAKCYKAIALLTWHFDRMEVFAVLLRSSTLNWQNPDVLAHLKRVTAIDPAEIRKSAQENSIALLEFSRETYSRIYGSA